MKKGQLLSKMIMLATDAHFGQFDRGGSPYILHALKVLHYTRSEDEEIQCIAVGHDLLEDTSVTIDKLFDEGFTERIVDAIVCLTKVKGQTYEEYKQKVFSNNDAMIVKMADLRHNSDIRRLKGVTEKDIERMVKYHKFYLELQQKVRK